MLGAIVGDIVGSVYEWHNIKTKEFPLFRAVSQKQHTISLTGLKTKHILI